MNPHMYENKSQSLSWMRYTTLIAESHNPCHKAVIPKSLRQTTVNLMNYNINDNHDQLSESNTESLLLIAIGPYDLSGTLSDQDKY